MAVSASLNVRGSLTAPFRPQFRHALTDLWNYTATPIEYYNLEGALISFHASAFLYRYQQKVYLVSALHCFTGKNVFTGSHISSDTGYEPRRIRVHPCYRNEAGDAGRVSIDVDLFAGDQALWLTDPDFEDLRTDIGALELTIDIGAGEFVCVNDGDDIDMHVAPGSEAYVVGYPFAHLVLPYAPIWRRGSFALDPSLPLDTKPIFLLDVRSTRGMSGSPILMRRFGTSVEHAQDGTIETAVRTMSTSFIGVYGGRILESDQPLGYGWYANRIENIINQQKDNSTYSLVGGPRISTYTNIAAANVRYGGSFRAPTIGDAEAEVTIKAAD